MQGFVLKECCRHYEFIVRSADTSHERLEFDAEVLSSGSLREFVGFNRARHALLEAAILATRFHMFSQTEIDSEFEKFGKIIAKTGDATEIEAMADLHEAHVRFRAAGARP